MDSRKIKIEKGDFIRVLVTPFEEWGWKFSKAQVEIVYPMIASYSLETVGKAANLLLAESRFKPKPVEIIDACKRFAPKNSNAAGEKFQAALVEKERQIGTDAQAYLKDFMLFRPISEQAKSEGWANHLEDFVRNTANTMLQIRSYSAKGTVIFGWNGAMLPRDFQHHYKQLLLKCVSNIRANQGFDVMDAMPSQLPNWWATQAQKLKEVA